MDVRTLPAIAVLGLPVSVIQRNKNLTAVKLQNVNEINKIKSTK